MPYLTYRTDIARAAKAMKKPAKAWAKSIFTVRDPFKLFLPTMKIVARGGWAAAQVLWFTGRKIANR